MSGLKFPKEETKKKRMSHPASILGSLECHQFGAHAVHKDQAVMDELHRLGQEAFENQIGSREQFRKIFGRNWL